jgi:hypothetical protein
VFIRGELACNHRLLRRNRLIFGGAHARPQSHVELDVAIVAIKGNTVKLGITAPEAVAVYREEAWQRVGETTRPRGMVPRHDPPDERNRVDGDDDMPLDELMAKLTRAAYDVALRHQTTGTWLDLELDLWRVVTHIFGRPLRSPRRRVARA